jgi:hypothetical protein
LSAYFTQTLCKNKALDFEQYLKRQAKAFATKLQVQPVVKVAAGSKIRKCQCCKTGNLHTIWCLISEDRLHRSLATAKINSPKKNNVGKGMYTKSEGEHDKTRLLLKKRGLQILLKSS